MAKPASSRRLRRVMYSEFDAVGAWRLGFMESALSLVSSVFFLPCTNDTLRSTDLTCDRLAQVPGASGSSDVRSANLCLGQNRGNGVFDGIGSIRDTKMAQHHGAGPDLPNGIGNAFSGDIRRRAVDRLKHGRIFVLRIEICRGSDADGANNGGTEIGEYVSKKIGAHDDIEPVGMANEVRGENVDVILVRANVRVLRSDSMKAFVPKGHGVDDAV